ncbi:MgtC family protein [Enterobacter mori]|uniref:MgtC family protein n=1 Tax=Enterobacter mori TaxID=539813 RepID=UPI0038928950
MLTGDKLMFPYISHLLAAMLLGAIIGAERQWRQRMAGLRTNALVATGAAVFILSSVSTSPDSPGRIAAQIVSGIGFLGAGVIMREGMNIRGLNTAATLWCSAGIGVLCGLGQFWNAAMASLIILCANILLREAAQRINQLPAVHEGEKCYILKITCSDEHGAVVRQRVVNMAKELTLGLKAISSATTEITGTTEIRAEVMTREEYRKLLDLIMGNIGGNKIIASVSCQAI